MTIIANDFGTPTCKICGSFGIIDKWLTIIKFKEEPGAFLGPVYICQDYLGTLKKEGYIEPQV